VFADILHVLAPLGLRADRVIRPREEGTVSSSQPGARGVVPWYRLYTLLLLFAQLWLEQGGLTRGAVCGCFLFKIGAERPEGEGEGRSAGTRHQAADRKPV